MAVMLESCGRVSGLCSAFDKRFQVVLSRCVGGEGVLGLSQVPVLFWSVDVALVLQCASAGFYGQVGENVASDPLLCHKGPIFHFLYVSYVCVFALL